MQAQPKTIADYKKALARLGVPLPAGTTKKADYEALWLSAATKKAASPPLKPRFVNPNVPLSMQEATLRATTCPSTFTQPPSTPATPAFETPEYSFASAPVEDESSSPPQVMDDHWLPAAPSAEVPCADEARTLQRESPKPRSRVHYSRKGATVTSSQWLVLVAALLVALGGGGYWMLPQCNLETGVNEPVGLIMAEITEEAADVIAPGAAVEIESIAEAAPVAAPEDKAEEAAEDKTEDNAEENAEDKAEDKAKDKAKDNPRNKTSTPAMHCSRRCLMQRKSRHSPMTPPAKRNATNATVNPVIATLAKTADLGAASRSVNKTPACRATFSRRTPFASTRVSDNKNKPNAFKIIQLQHVTYMQCTFMYVKNPYYKAHYSQNSVYVRFNRGHSSLGSNRTLICSLREVQSSCSMKLMMGHTL